MFRQGKLKLSPTTQTTVRTIPVLSNELKQEIANYVVQYESPDIESLDFWMEVNREVIRKTKYRMISSDLKYLFKSEIFKLCANVKNSKDAEENRKLGRAPRSNILPVLACKFKSDHIQQILTACADSNGDEAKDLNLTGLAAKFIAEGIEVYPKEIELFYTDVLKPNQIDIAEANWTALPNLKFGPLPLKFKSANYQADEGPSFQQVLPSQIFVGKNFTLISNEVNWINLAELQKLEYLITIHGGRVFLNNEKPEESLYVFVGNHTSAALSYCKAATNGTVFSSNLVYLSIQRGSFSENDAATRLYDAHKHEDISARTEENESSGNILQENRNSVDRSQTKVAEQATNKKLTISASEEVQEDCGDATAALHLSSKSTKRQHEDVSDHSLPCEKSSVEGGGKKFKPDDVTEVDKDAMALQNPKNNLNFIMNNSVNDTTLNCQISKVTAQNKIAESFSVISNFETALPGLSTSVTDREDNIDLKSKEQCQTGNPQVHVVDISVEKSLSLKDKKMVQRLVLEKAANHKSVRSLSKEIADLCTQNGKSMTPEGFRSNFKRWIKKPDAYWLSIIQEFNLKSSLFIDLKNLHTNDSGAD